jgi:hypothetical protein
MGQYEKEKDETRRDETRLSSRHRSRRLANPFSGGPFLDRLILFFY